MTRVLAKASTLFLFTFVACGSQAQDLCVPQAEGALRHLALRNVTEEDAKVLEEKLVKKPDDLDAREKLIVYYFRARLESRAPELEERGQQHIFWLIEHCPESELAGSPEAGIDAMRSGSTEPYQRGKQLWLQQAEKHSANLRVLCNAAQFLTLWDQNLAQELLEKALLLDPNDSRASTMLAQSYMHERILAQSAEEKLALAQKALSLRERSLHAARDQERFYALDEVASAAFEAGETSKAQQYATELLQSASSFKHDWNYGNAIHKGNIILGRLALQRGDIPAAKQHLLAAGETPGSPQLNSFGPNMTLAKELVEKGERESVLTYLHACAKFWEMGKDRLQGWTATLKSGGVPDFSSNLHY